ncbi:MAG: hypothetical protein BWY93_01938 [Euryarchaeota archaeon ADurb.BinA087]|nr:MAG: hypothetical protein BWY93_01938 [Euryarchaeota archaeon ADurb.BinA087]
MAIAPPRKPFSRIRSPVLKVSRFRSPTPSSIRVRSAAPLLRERNGPKRVTWSSRASPDDIPASAGKRLISAPRAWSRNRARMI